MNWFKNGIWRRYFNACARSLLEIELTARVLSRLNVLFLPNTRGPLVNDCSDGLLRALTRRGRRGSCHIALLSFDLSQRTAWLTSTNSFSVFFLIQSRLCTGCAIYNWTNISHYRMSQHGDFCPVGKGLFLPRGVANSCKWSCFRPSLEFTF